MIAAVLAMYSAKSSSVFNGGRKGRGLGLTVEALKVAGAKAERANYLGWSLLLAKTGDKKACINAMKHLQALGVPIKLISGVIEWVIGDNRCGVCHGTKTQYSTTGKRWIDCKTCLGTGKKKLNINQICEKHNCSKQELDEIISMCHLAQSDAEQAIYTFLNKEKFEK